jgi:hypothetical protein
MAIDFAMKKYDIAHLQTHRLATDTETQTLYELQEKGLL